MEAFFNLPLFDKVVTLLLFTVCVSFLFFVFFRLIKVIKLGNGKKSISIGSDNVSDEDINRIADIDMEIIKFHQWFATIDYLKTKKIMDLFDLLSEKAVIDLKQAYIVLKEKLLKEKGYDNGELSSEMNNQETRFYYLVQEMQKEILSKKVRYAMCKVNLNELKMDKDSPNQLTDFEQYVNRYTTRWLADIDNFYQDHCYDLCLPSYNKINKSYESQFKKEIENQLINLFYQAKEIHKEFDNEAKNKEEKIKELSKEKVKLMINN